MRRQLSVFVAAFVLMSFAKSASATIAVDVTTFKDLSAATTTLTTPAFSTMAGNELLLAFIATDYISGANTKVSSVVGAGLTWVLVVRTNTQSGSSEIWRAFAPGSLANVTITATTSQSVVSSLTVMTFTGVDPSGTNGSGAIGAFGGASAASGLPAASVVTTRNGSLVVGVGNDYDKAVARTPSAGQTLVHQFLTSTGDTYWVQRQNIAAPAAGTSVSISDTAPTGDRYNLSVCEILADPSVGQTWNLSGQLLPTTGGSGATVVISGTPLTTVADASGNYSFAGVANGTYTVVPSHSGYTFTPASQTVTLNGSVAINVNFTATSLSDPSLVGQWSPPVDLGLVAVNMVMMHTGKVLMYSGSYTISGIERVWDPATGSITLAPNPFYNLFCSGHSQLADGRILVVGGYDTASLGAANANIFDPVTQTWSALPNMAYRRWYPTSTTLPDGRALVTSGAQTCLTCLADVPEIFDPATGRFTTAPTARLAVPYYPFMFVMADGTVLDAGANEDAVATSKLDPVSKTWTTVDSVVTDGHSAAMYQIGKILKSGTAADSGTAGNAAATAFVLDMSQPSPAWRQVTSMANPRAFHNTTLLPDGTVLVTGGGTTLDGYDISKSVKAAELWTPASETWRTLSSATIPRLYHSTALLLPDGRVLTAGSGDDGPAVNQTQAEIFSPPYLFKGPRPTITDAPQTAQYGSTLSVQTPDAASIASVSLMRPGAVTHGFDEDQRFLNLAFSASGTTLTIQTPASANLAPPGYYMLFLLNTAGVPSIASFVHFQPTGVDTEPPTPPISLSGLGAIGSAALTWTAATDNTGVALYNVHRSPTSGFQPSASNRVGQATTTNFADTGVSAGNYSYLVTAQDVAGNVSAPSNEASVLVFADVTPPVVTMTAPSDQATVLGSITVRANASDDVGVAGVQFQLDGNALGAERTSPPYSITWSTPSTSNGSHVVGAVARDAAGNHSQSTVSVTVSNSSTNPSGLVAAYGFNEGSGVQVIDASGQGNTGTISSATRTASGRFGGALSFDGTSAWVTIADAPSLRLTTGMTIEAWVNPSSGTGWRSVVMKETAGGLAYATYAANNASRPAAYIHTNTDLGLNGTSAVPVNAWTHLAWTFDGSTMRMFVNGAQVSTRSTIGTVAATGGALRIGGDSVWGEYFKGLIDEVRIYNRALSAAEIQTDMNTPIP